MKYLILFFAIASLYSCKQSEDKKSAEWKLVWSDEFDKDGLPDSTKWGYDTGGHGWGNHELQYYTANRLENARQENGNLIIEARKEDWEGNEYSSARLVTRDKFELTYGKIEVRAQLPAGRGTWPAIWMLAATKPLSWPQDGEIDIMEHVGYDPGVIHGTIHCAAYNHRLGTQKGTSTMVADFDKTFHNYQLRWDADSIHIGVDDNYYFHFGNEHSGKETWPFDSAQYLLMNIAVGGDWGGQKGVDSTIFPQIMKVDYVHIYKKD